MRLLLHYNVAILEILKYSEICIYKFEINIFKEIKKSIYIHQH